MSETIHYEAKWKGDRSTVPHCTKWSMRPKFGITTTDLTKVNCTRCAKQMGVTPATKEKAKNLGTCPCCFRQQKTLKGARMVVHGYTRPGYGWIQGTCFGANGVGGVHYPRFEDSCEGTKVYKVELETYLGRTQEYLGKLTSGAVTSLAHTFEVKVRDENGKLVRDAYHRTQTKSVRVFVVEGDEAKDVLDDGTTRAEFTYQPGSHRIPSFAQLMEREISDTKRTIDQLVASITELQVRINGWVKVG